MKKTLLALGALGVLGIGSADAQYYDIINQATSAIMAPLSGSSSYKGFVEASYVKGLGDMNADFYELTTTQGYQYNSWFYMGVGLGVSLIHSHSDGLPAIMVDQYDGYYPPRPSYPSEEPFMRPTRDTGVMIPLFTDFRFTPWGSNTGAYLDLRAGCDFLIGNKPLRIHEGYLTNQQYFYFKPTIGVRIPTNLKNPKQAFDVGITYQLLTSNYWSWGTTSQTLNSLGLTIGYEW